MKHSSSDITYKWSNAGKHINCSLKNPTVILYHFFFVLFLSTAASRQQSNWESSDVETLIMFLYRISFLSNYILDHQTKIVWEIVESNDCWWGERMKKTKCNLYFQQQHSPGIFEYEVVIPFCVCYSLSLLFQRK